MNIIIELNEHEFKHFGSKEAIESILKGMVPIEHTKFRVEHIEHINTILDLIEDDTSILNVNVIKDMLAASKIIVPNDSEYVVNKIYRDNFKLLLHDIVDEEYDIFTASHIAIIQILMENGNAFDNDYYFKDASMYLYHQFFHTYSESLMRAKEKRAIKDILDRRHEVSIILS